MDFAIRKIRAAQGRKSSTPSERNTSASLRACGHQRRGERFECGDQFVEFRGRHDASERLRGGWMSCSSAERTWASVPQMPAPTRAAVCPPPGCSRSMVVECHRRATGSLGTARVRMPALRNPWTGACTRTALTMSSWTRPSGRTPGATSGRRTSLPAQDSQRNQGEGRPGQMAGIRLRPTGCAGERCRRPEWPHRSRPRPRSQGLARRYRGKAKSVCLGAVFGADEKACGQCVGEGEIAQCRLQGHGAVPQQPLALRRIRRPGRRLRRLSPPAGVPQLTIAAVTCREHSRMVDRSSRRGCGGDSVPGPHL